MIIGIDPGPTLSAVVTLTKSGHVMDAMQQGNDVILQLLRDNYYGSGYLAIEMIESFGMPVGREVFDTLVWIGRFQEAHKGMCCKITRGEVKIHLCCDRRVKDTHVRQALIDRYGPYKQAAIGTKKTPGPLYGLKYDMWQALAVAVTFQDTRLETFNGQTSVKGDLYEAREQASLDSRG